MLYRFDIIGFRRYKLVSVKFQSRRMNTILVVDDNQMLVGLIEINLGKAGYNSLKAYDGLEAQSLISKSASQIDAIILDWDMPEMSGIELLKWIKTQKGIRDIPVIMATGKSEPEHIKLGIEAGAFYYLTKPIEIDLLYSIVRAAIDDFNRRNSLLKRIRESEDVLKLLVEGVFRFRILPEAEKLSVYIAQITDSPEIGIGVNELFINAVEHGNLGITYDEKTEFLNRSIWKAEIERRQALSENAAKFVEVSITRYSVDLMIDIKDQGSGFDFENYLEIDE